MHHLNHIIVLSIFCEVKRRPYTSGIKIFVPPEKDIDLVELADVRVNKLESRIIKPVHLYVAALGLEIIDGIFNVHVNAVVGTSVWHRDYFDRIAVDSIEGVGTVSFRNRKFC